jgi:rhomboid family GlyGly-CTERM serine protease
MATFPSAFAMKNIRVPVRPTIRQLAGAGIVLAAALALSACALFPRREHHRSSSVVAFLFPDQQPLIQEPAMPVLKLPLRVGLAFVPAEYGAPDRFTESRKQVLLERIANEFRGQPFVQSIQTIPELYLRAGGGFQNLDQLRGLLGIDVVVLLSYDQSQFSTDRTSSIAYWTIVGAYFVEGNRNDTHTLMEATVYDIASRTLLFHASGVDSHARQLVARRRRARVASEQRREPRSRNGRSCSESPTRARQVQAGAEGRHGARKGGASSRLFGRGCGGRGESRRDACRGAGRTMDAAVATSKIGRISDPLRGQVKDLSYYNVHFCAMTGRFPWLTLVGASFAISIAFVPTLGAALQFDRAAIVHGQFWRLVTGHFAHWSFEHLTWSAIAFLVCDALAEAHSRWQWITTVAASALAISIGLVGLAPGLAYYRGLSGIDSALFVSVLVTLGRNARRARSVLALTIVCAASLGVAGKIIFELATGRDLFLQGDADVAIVMPLAHVIGAVVGGIVTWLLARISAD